MAIAFVTGQTKSGTSDGLAATLAAAAFTSNNTAGNCLCVGVTWGGTDISANAGFTVTDNAAGGSNTYTRALSGWDSSNTQGLAIFYALNLKSTATLTVTANFASTNVTFRRIIVCEYSGVATSSAADGTSGINNAVGSTAANNIVSTNGTDPTTTASGDLLFGTVVDDDGGTSIAAGTNFTERNSVNGEDLEVADRVLAGTGTVVATWTFGAAHRYLAGCIALKPPTASSLPRSSINMQAVKRAAFYRTWPTDWPFRQQRDREVMPYTPTDLKTLLGRGKSWR